MEMTPPEIIICKAGRGIAYPRERYGYKVIPCWSRGSKPWKDLSPFFMGPVRFWDSDEKCIREAQNFENFWQSFKVYLKATKQIFKDEATSTFWKSNPVLHVKADGERMVPNEEWFKWSRSLQELPFAIRHPNGSKSLPLFSWFEGTPLNVVEARKRIYIPYYQQLLRKHPTYMKLLELYKSGVRLYLLDPDGPPTPESVNFDRLIELQSITTYSDGLKYRPYGHAYVIALTLIEDYLAPKANKKLKEGE